MLWISGRLDNYQNNFNYMYLVASSLVYSAASIDSILLDSMKGYLFSQLLTLQVLIVDILMICYCVRSVLLAAIDKLRPS